MQKNQRDFLPYREKLRIIEEFNLPSVERYGLYTPTLPIQKSSPQLNYLLTHPYKHGISSEDTDSRENTGY